MKRLFCIVRTVFLKLGVASFLVFGMMAMTSLTSPSLSYADQVSCYGDYDPQECVPTTPVDPNGCIQVVGDGYSTTLYYNEPCEALHAKEK